MRKVFLEDLPRYKKRIDWKNCIGYIINFVYDDIEGNLEIIDYNKKNQNLYIKYINKNIYKSIHTNCLINCNLGILLGKITTEFKVEIGAILKDEKRDITIIDRKIKDMSKKDGSKKFEKAYKFICNKCGFDCGESYINGEYKEEHWILEGNLLKGVGCSCCCNPPRMLVQGINDIPTTDPWMIKFFQGGYDEAKKYTKSSGQKIYPICPDCGRIKNKKISISTIYTCKSISCSCGDGFSYPNKFMFNVLEQLNIEFINEWNPKWANGRIYDFYIPSKNMIIEMDGGLGHGKKSHGLDNKTSIETKEIDDLKDIIAKEHNINVIRIDSEESELKFIKNNIFKSELNNLFNLSNINWYKVEEFALGNMVKEVCKFKKDNPNLTTLEIGNILKLCRNTVRNYLTRGNKIWDWCNYNPKEEVKSNILKVNKLREKQVEVFKNGDSLGIFSGSKELCEVSEDLFGTKFCRSNIGLVCTGKYKQHKGYTFKYVENQTNKESA